MLPLNININIRIVNGDIIPVKTGPNTLIFPDLRKYNILE